MVRLLHKYVFIRIRGDSRDSYVHDKETVECFGEEREQITLPCKKRECVRNC